MKKIVFLTGTRADYGKLKRLMREVQKNTMFEMHVFVTGMHMLKKYGSTYKEIEKDGFRNIYRYINQKPNTSEQMDMILASTISGFSSYISEVAPDLIIVHGDRVEALAGTIVGALNNIKVMHIEGGEVSGTIDESIRHAITKMAHFHLVANEEAYKRIEQLGEKKEDIYVFGSADLDIMYSDELPCLQEVRRKYDIPFEDYGIVMYHPVTTESDKLQERVQILVQALIASERNYVVIYPNNDIGSDIILKAYESLEVYERVKVFPSMRFEYFLTLLKHSRFIIGNSSCGVREAPVYGVPTIDIGNRQKGRYALEDNHSIVHIQESAEAIHEAINYVETLPTEEQSYFGEGKSGELFMEIIQSQHIWQTAIQKSFNDIDF